jgi:rubrerythrin
MSEEKLVDVCKEYFEISIGYRQPTKSEQSTAGELWLKRVLSEREYDMIDLIKMIKYPLAFDSDSHNLYLHSEPKMWILRTEVAIYRILSDETPLVEGPFIPMLRYEIRTQQSLLDQSEYIFAVLRQRALFETFFREKAGLGQVDWKWTLKSAYRGEEIISSQSYNTLDEHTEDRNKFAHDWFSYLNQCENNTRQTVLDGLNIMSILLSKELYKTYQSCFQDHPSQRFFAKLEQRKLADISSSARVSVTITCDFCGQEFNPQDHWKRCPDCDSPHRHWEE